MSRVLITAGGSGIGQAMAMAFEQSGFDVWITDIDAKLLGKCPGSWQKTQQRAARGERRQKSDQRRGEKENVGKGEEIGGRRE